MANRYALVPESWLSSLKSGEQPESSSFSEQPESSKVVFREEKKKNDFSQLADLLPKNLQSKARVLFHYISAVSVNDMQRVVYEDGTVGSHIIDLVRYTISPFVKRRPLDWPQFSNLLEKLGVPDSIIAKRNNSNSTVAKRNNSSLLDRWQPY